MADKSGDKDVPDFVNVYDAKTQLSQLLARVEAGEEIVIARAGRPVARLVPFERKDRVLGRMKGRIKIHENFDDPIPELEDPDDDHS